MIYRDFCGKKLSALGMGCMRLPVTDEKNSSIDKSATREMIDYAIKNGVIVGNHSYSHPHFSALDMAECTAEIHQCECLLDQLYREAGIRRLCRPFRFPYGDKGGKNKAALVERL